MKPESGGRPRLSKSRFLSGLQCRRRLWLEVHRRDLASAPSEATQRIFDTGHEVGRLAQERFPGGVLIDPPHYEVERALRETEEAIRTGATVLYEPAFLHDNILVRVDILQRGEDEGWNLIEVKSSTGTSETNLADAAVQRHVLTGAGLRVGAVYVMHLNRQCRYPDLSDLFVLDEVTERIEPVWERVETRIPEFNRLIGEPEMPEVPVGSHCRKPYECPFISQCWSGVAEPSIYTIPRINRRKADALAARGIVSLSELPADVSLSENQQRYVDLIRSGEPEIDWEAIDQELSKLRFPLHFLDFETMADAVPRLEGLGPYDSYPFQYSLHTLTVDGEVEHREYLHPDTDDPRRPVMESLIRAIGAEGSIVAYNASFEKRVIAELGDRFPEHRRLLRSYSGRLWDLLDIFRYHYHDPRFAGSNSIKRVLPVLVPELSYGDLDVQSGDLAQVAWSEMVQTEDDGHRLKLDHALREYCRLDTWAMVRLYQVLRQARKSE